MISFFVIMLIVMYYSSAICAGLYFDGYPFKIIYLIATITPILNTYLAFKYITKDYSSFREAIKYHFTCGK